MVFKEKGKYNPKALEYLEEVQPLEFAKLSPLRRLDNLLGVVESLSKDNLQNYIKKLVKNYKNRIDTEYVNPNSSFLPEILAELQNLKKYPELVSHNLNFFLNILDLPLDDRWKVDKIKVPQKSFLRSFLVPKYVNLESLAETLGRTDAISIYKKYITNFLVSIYEDQEDEVEDLKSLFQKFFEEEEPKESESWVVIYREPAAGKLVFRKDVCLWDETLSDLPDEEFKYLVCCYGDFQGIKSENKHFILTMEHTIAKGDPYCSCIVHVTRIDWNLKHPSKEYWDNIWPLQKWQKRE